MTAATPVSVIQRWRERKVTAVVWSHAPGHYRNAYENVLVWCIEHLASSPVLNAATRVFASLRSRIEEKTDGSFVAKQAAVEQEVQRWAADGEQINVLRVGGETAKR